MKTPRRDIKAKTPRRGREAKTPRRVTKVKTARRDMWNKCWRELLTDVQRKAAWKRSGWLYDQPQLRQKMNS